MSSYVHVPSCERVRDFLAVLNENPNLKNRIESLFAKAQLSADEVRVIGLAYGINGEIHLIRNISQITNTSVDRVAEIEEKAVQKLRRAPDIGDLVFDFDRFLVREVTKIVASFYGVEMARVCGKGRKSEAVKVRYVTAYILIEDFELSLKAIGAELGRHYATLLHGCNEIRQLVNSSFSTQAQAKIRKEIQTIRERVESGGLF